MFTFHDDFTDSFYMSQRGIHEYFKNKRRERQRQEMGFDESLFETEHKPTFDQSVKFVNVNIDPSVKMVIHVIETKQEIYTLYKGASKRIVRITGIILNRPAYDAFQAYKTRMADLKTKSILWETSPDIDFQRF